MCRPGGLVAVRDSDYAAMTWFPAIPRLDRWLALYHAVARATAASPTPAGGCSHWARAAGFATVAATAAAWCFATPEDRAWWGGTVGGPGDALGVRRSGGRARPGDAATSSRTWPPPGGLGGAPDGWFAVLHGELLARVPG